MNRIWLVDDDIPWARSNKCPAPVTLDARSIKYLVENVPQEDGGWSPQMHGLCDKLCAEYYDALFFLAPELVLSSIQRGATPPHVIIFDWEYPGSTVERNLKALNELLDGCCSFIQVYTQVGPTAVDPHMTTLRTKHPDRVLPTCAKGDVEPADLLQRVKQASSDSLSGAAADVVRSRFREAVETSLIALCELSKGEVADLLAKRAENLVHIVLAMVRDRLGNDAEEVYKLVQDAVAGKTSDPLRRLLSTWYYYFPRDQRVRRGDLIEVQGGLGLVVTPSCDLARFGRKSGGHLTWVRCRKLTTADASALRDLGYNFHQAGTSITATTGSESLIILPNVPQAEDRKVLEDYVVLCHAWESTCFPPPAKEAPSAAPAAGPGDPAPPQSATANSGTDGDEFDADAPSSVSKPQADLAKKAPSRASDVQAPVYYDTIQLRRRCTLAEPFAGAAIGHAIEVVSGVGATDWPGVEGDRLNLVLNPAFKKKAPKGAAGPPKGPTNPPKGEKSAGDVGAKG